MAADFWTVAGITGTFVFGGISVFQLLRDMKRASVWDARAKHLVAVKMGLVQLRVMLTEAGTTEEVVKTDAVRQFVRQIGHHVLSVEHHIDGMLEADQKAAAPKPHP